MTTTNDQLNVDDPDVIWRNFLTDARATLSAELLALPQRIRDPHTLGVQINLRLSIRCCDVGPDQALRDSGYDLTTTRLGALMRDAGHEAVGADPSRNYSGVMPWFGSLPEVEYRLSERAKKRAIAEARLAESLLTDEQRAQRDAEAAELREAFNKMKVKIGPNGEGLVAYAANGDAIDPSELTPIQRKAIEQMDATFRWP
jgi:hypothetical protein